ncbi:hypothetical protein [Pseudalkalibacillus caeni]|uniref:Uncharacterized protein n=1 Tax=Exobacillus caeni TaxID=2574798 RepID=A0A5R9FBY4_9BACL|nr:hypothetical protein [Pseudalkalibacillus caeni]TLS38403.1 hypothetical protein FCL54_04475 [Pseudalkalibacillus caeni]
MRKNHNERDYQMLLLLIAFYILPIILYVLQRRSRVKYLAIIVIVLNYFSFIVLIDVLWAGDIHPLSTLSTVLIIFSMFFLIHSLVTFFRYRSLHH